ncbi:MAG TPA: FAD-linked oxidase C-terminal domain-containing protein [Chloroflexota bacterium]|nr:FAD-linked oxidase C-terminal domain-containing protein [Chloroflexota bacterium]
MAVAECADLGQRLIELLGEDAVLHQPEDVIVYEYDYGLDRAVPQAVVFPRSAAEVVAVVKLARELDLPVVPRGAGTGISGGAIAVQGGIVIALARMKRILDIDLANRAAVVEPGVVNLNISKAVEPYGLFFAPDPSSQKACTIGGNVANNAGGPHCLALGTTTNHVLGLEIVTAEGEIVALGGVAPERPGYDLTGFVVGSEGTVGIVTKVFVKLLPKPAAVKTLLAIFDSVDQASASVSGIIGRGIIPSALELMDQLALRAVEAAFHAGYPPDAGAVLLVEVDGLAESVAEQSAAVEHVCRDNGARDVRLAKTDEARARLWAARKGAASAMGRIAPNYYLHDTVIARTRLPEVLARVVEIGERHRLPIANLFHAGDGNLHPMILFDIREQGILERVMEAGREILQTSVEAGGTISGEHGIGVEKNRFMPWIFSQADLDVMARARDAFDPSRRCNPGKVFPIPSACHDTSSRPRARLGRVAASHPDLWV